MHDVYGCSVRAVKARLEKNKIKRKKEHITDEN